MGVNLSSPYIRLQCRAQGKRNSKETLNKSCRNPEKTPFTPKVIPFMSKVIPFISYYPFMICNFMPKVSPLPCGDKCPKKSWKHMKNIERQLKPSSRIPMTPHFFVLWSPGPFALILGPLLFCSGCCTTSHHLTKFISRATQVAPHNIGALAR